MDSLIGIGLRHCHFSEILENRPRVGWFEVHSENYFGQDTLERHYLHKIRQDYPISLHGVGLSLGRPDDLDFQHLQRLKELVEFVEPMLISEHLSWGALGAVHVPDLLPLPYTHKMLQTFVEHVEQTQDFLGRRILVENPSSYLMFPDNEMSEVDFWVEMARRSGCGLLLDVNNVYVSCHNHGWDPQRYIRSIPADLVEEIHVAGHSPKTLPDDTTILIDSHDEVVCEEVWQLYAEVIALLGACPTLLERDANIPTVAELLLEVDRAKASFPRSSHAA